MSFSASLALIEILRIHHFSFIGDEAPWYCLAAVTSLSAKLAEKDIQLALVRNKINEKQAAHLRERIKTNSA